jgi:hypothetical protein
VSSNFNVSTQETTAFYEGFLRPVDLHLLNYFIRQGYSRELLFWLFTESVETGPPNHPIGFQYDPPGNYGCPPQDPRNRCFREFVEIAVITGLTVETRTVGGGDKGAKTERDIYARFCFSPVLAEIGRQAIGPERVRELRRYLDPYAPQPTCGDPNWNPAKTADLPQLDTLQFHVGPIEFRIVTRSAFGIFQFLGKLLKMKRDGLLPASTAYFPPGRRDQEMTPPVLLSVLEDQNLLTVTNAPVQECFIRTAFIDGEYCVPERDSENTKRIFSLLAQLIALQTQASDLSITPTVRTIQ